MLWRAVCCKIFFREFVGTTAMLQFRKIKMCHSRRLKYVISEILQYFNFREIEICLFGRLGLQFSRDKNVICWGDWKVTFSGNEKNELPSFWKTKFFIFFRRNHAHKKNWKSKPKTKSESKHTRGTTNVDRICHEIQPAS